LIRFGFPPPMKN